MQWLFYFDFLFQHINNQCANIKTQRGIELKKKAKVKVWVDIDRVVKTSIVPKKLKWYEREMLVVPKGEKASS